ncbi:pRiA4b ORF-3-like protein [Tenacibaculum adriaticum]|uniref:PRiA4b ORF-3-like protein n=1 Tax=Tenacibaculum adriaticum TaxID=413713 RepID=A0A5S5DUJ6_9FLAO|nr:plasmid pRiA4b ORF-3 family protein [Tenacibaculum adriaticum]TYP98289.1 pRiA4b ORF-3-like protein [Tenacibaculum adriaticum]
MYKVRVILDTKEDVIRTLLVDEKQSLEDLHFTIAKAFGFNGQEMASFYRSDNEWNQGEEIPLFNMAEAGEGVSMATCTLNETLPNESDKLIYVYDFLQMWTFYVEVLEQSDEITSEAKILLSIGNIPDEAPKKEFTADKLENDFDDEFDDEFDDKFNDFENLDDIDFDTY